MMGIEKVPTMSDYFAQLKKSRERYKAVIEHQIEKAKKAGSEEVAFGRTWIDSPAIGRNGYYQEGARHSFEGLGGYTFLSLQKKIAALDAEGRKTLVLDHLGNGRPGVELGAHKVITTSRIRSESADPRVVQIPGDALSFEVADGVTREIEKFISTAMETGPRPFIIAYLRPIAGLGESFTNLYVFHRLYTDLRHLYNLMSDGDLINIDSIGTGHDMSILQEILHDAGAGELLHTQRGKITPVLIEKNSDVCRSLPTEAEALQTNPSLARRLMRLDDMDERNPFRLRNNASALHPKGRPPSQEHQKA